MTTRVLNLDLDFFLQDVAHWRAPTDDRLDAAECPPWSLDDAMAFLEGQCGLTHTLPGFVVVNHGELFALWRGAIENGRLQVPFHLTHVDAHADLGMGDIGYEYLMTELLFEEPEARRYPDPERVQDGNWLAFALACRWVSDMIYVTNERGGNDLFPYYMEDYDVRAAHLELRAVRLGDLDTVRRRTESRPPVIARTEPRIPLRQERWDTFQANEPFDVICLAQSPPFTPAEADPIFEAVRERFIDETVFV